MNIKVKNGIFITMSIFIIFLILEIICSVFFVYNSRYLDYFDAAITEYMRHCGFNYVTDARNTGKDFHLVKASVEFLKPVPYDEEIEIGVRVGRIGRSSLCWELGLFQKESEELSTTGEIIWVYTNIENHQSEPIPEERKKQLTEPPTQ